MNKLFNKNINRKKLSKENIIKILKRSQLYSSLDFADTFLQSIKEK